MDKNIGGYTLSALSFFGVALTQESGLELVGAWLAVISAALSLLWTFSKVIMTLYKQLKEARADKKITAEEKEQIKNTIINGAEEVKEDLDNLNNTINKGGK